MSAKIIGSGFYGRPLVVSDLVGTSAVVTHDNGRVLTIRVIVARGTRLGPIPIHIVFAHGQRTSCDTPCAKKLVGAQNRR